MKTATRFLSFVSATLVAFTSAAWAQITTLQTETQTGYFGSVVTFTDLAGTASQKFTNISAVTSLTFNFFAGSGNGNQSLLTELEARFGEWDGSGLKAGTVVNFEPFQVAPSTDASWSNTLSITNAAFRNYFVEFDFTKLSGPLVDSIYGYITDPSKTYAFLLQDQTGSTNLGFGVNYSDTFTHGGAFAISGPDFVFSQISVVPGDQPILVPESSTVAAFLGAALVGGLVTFRLRQRRQQLAPVAIAA